MSSRNVSNPSAVALSLFRDLLTGQWFVCRIDMAFGNMTNQTLFSSAVILEDAFHPSFVDQLSRFLPRRPEAQVTVEATMEFNFEHLTLTGIRVIAMKVMDGVQMVVVRFNYADGVMTSILSPEYRPNRMVTPQQDDEDDEEVSAPVSDDRLGPTRMFQGRA